MQTLYILGNEIAYTPPDGDLRLQLAFPHPSGNGFSVDNYTFPQPEGNWGEAELAAMVQARFPQFAVAWRHAEKPAAVEAES